MSSKLGFDPNDYDYGPATASIRKIIVGWSEIDWFVPSGASDAELSRIFDDHNQLARRHSPGLLPERVELRCVLGGLSEFDAWCKRVRTRATWDWKFDALKKLSDEHSKARGWNFGDQAAHLPSGRPRPGDLFGRLDRPGGAPITLWNVPLTWPLDAKAPEGQRFYVLYASMDGLSCIQWQLADADNDTTSNPFLPLLHCYRAGAYPFSVDRDTVVLFRFAADERQLPKVTLLP